MNDPHEVTDMAIRLRVVIARVGRQLNASAAGEGLTPSQASALGVIAVRSPLELSRLTALEGLNPTMASRVVGKLEELGLIRRISNPHDLRSVSLEITDEGTVVNDHVRAARALVVARCLAGMPEESRRALAEALPALEDFAEALTHQGEDPVA